MTTQKLTWLPALGKRWPLQDSPWPSLDGQYPGLEGRGFGLRVSEHGSLTPYKRWSIVKDPLIAYCMAKEAVGIVGTIWRERAVQLGGRMGLALAKPRAGLQLSMQVSGTGTCFPESLVG